ncbi:MAG: amino acid adenylation domain-containing protein, partial [Bacilli bacterium]|nr:amino acid adenylation domain-containing protein [Bacilli bacterium]
MLLKLFAETVRLFPKNLAVVYKEDRLTYEELYLRSRKVASRLRKLGAKKGDFVTIELPNCANYFAAIMGSWMVGAAFASLTNYYPKERLDYIASDCRASVRINIEALKGIEEEEPIENWEDNDPEDYALLVYTSGSTGKPKGVLHNHQSIFDAAMRSKSMMGNEHYEFSGHHYLLSIPLSFVVAMQASCSVLTGGIALYLGEVGLARDVNKLSDFINDNDINITFIPPKLFRVFKQKGHSLHNVTVGGEKCSNVYSDEFEVANGYGSSETCGGVLFFPIDKPYENTPVGKPIRHEKVYLLDEDGRDSNEGEICITGNFASCYLNLKEESERTFVPNPFKDKDGFKTMVRTGDLGRRLPSGDIIYINRRDWMIKINGQRVEPGEIEGTIRSIPAIGEAAVKDFVGSAGQTYICAYYVVKPGESITEEEIKAHMEKVLPSYMIPAYFIKLDKLPLNENGKLNRHALLAPDLSKVASAYIAPRNETEERLCDAFAKVLNVEKVGIHDDFFYLGGDSIKVMELQRLLPDLGLSTKLIYDHRNVMGIAENLEKRVEAPKADLDKSYPLTQAQLGIFLISKKREGEAVYNNPVLISFPKNSDTDKLSKAIEKAVRAHPGLFASANVDETGTPYIRYNPEFASMPIVSVEKMEEENLEKEKPNLEKPFLISKDRLFRFRIIETEKKKYLFMDIHHLVFDGFSMGVLMSDILSAYEGKEIEEETYTAFDESIKEEELRRSETYLEAKKWYLEEFSDIDEVSLPEGDEKDAEARFGSLKLALDIPFDELRKYCQEKKTTENIVTTSAFGLLLSAYTMKKKAAFATVYNGRHDLTSARTVSMFVRTLPVLCKVDSSIAVEDYLEANKKLMMGAMVNDSFSFAELCANSGYSSDVLFTYQGDLFEMPEFKEGKLKIEDLPFNATGEKLSIQIYPKEGKLELDLQYHENLYSKDFIKTFAKRYEQVLKNLLNAKILAEASLLDEKSTREIIALSKGVDVPYDKSKTFVDLFLNRVKEDGDATAVVDYRSSYTYRELDEASNILANYLKAKGVEEKEFVAIKMNRVKEFVASVLAIQKAGAAYVPIDPAYPEQRIEYMVEDSKAKVVLTEALFEEAMKDKPSNKPINLTRPEIPAYMIYTSGSTGKPKGVVITHLNLATMLVWNVADLRISKNSRNLAHASFSFDASVIDIFPVLSAGGRLYILNEEQRMNLDEISDYINENHITGMNASTAIGMSLINTHPEMPLDYFLMGGEKMLPCKKTGLRLINAYGPTEFTVASSYHEVDQEKDKDIPIGKAVANSYSFICDASGNLLPLGMNGELCLSGEQISQGYWNREELTDERFVPCPFLPGQKMYRTGDLARYNKDGDLEYMGRIDFQVKLRGFRIELGEIENCASQYEGIKQAAAEVRNSRLVLYYSASSRVDESDLRKKMAETLTEYMVPTVYVYMDEMPLTPNGKINRKALPDPELSAEETVAPRNENEQKAFDCLADIVGYREFGVTTDFELVGLTSLGAMQFVSRLDAIFGTTIRMVDLEKYPTVASLVEYIAEKGEESTYEIQEDYPLTMVQKGILAEIFAHPDSTIYNIPILIELPSSIDLDKLASSIKTAIDAHPVLKMHLIQDATGEVRAKRNDEEETLVTILEQEPEVNELIKPFDLFKDSLYRAYILKGKKNHLFIDAHHIAFDGESLEILLRDIKDAYEGNRVEKETYTEFEEGLDEERRHQGEILEDAKKWYRSLLDGRDLDCLPVNDRNLKEGEKGSFNLPLELDMKEFESFLKENKITANAAWISSFGLALSRFLNRKDAIFTTVYNGRNSTRIAGNVGMFVKTLPVVLDPFASSDSITYIRSTANQLQKSMANDIYGFMEMAHDLEVRADILFVYEGKIGGGWSIAGEKAPKFETLSVSDNKSPILIAITETPDGFGVHTEYDSKKYEEWSLTSLIKAMIASFKALIKGENPNEINLLSKEDKKVIDRFNKTDKKVEKTDLVTLFRRKAKEYPDNVAVIYEDKSLTYKELDELTERVATNLSHRGIGRGKVVSVMVSRSIYMAVCPLAVMKTGAAYQPLDSSYPEERLEFMAKDASAAMFISEKPLLGKLPDLGLPLICVEEFDALPKLDEKLTGPSADDLMILLYTSGTTGVPKGVMLSQFNLVNFASWYRDYYSLTPTSVVAAYAGFGFDACMMDLYPALTSGAAVCVVPEDIRMNFDQLKAYFEKNHVSHSFMTTQVGRLFAEENSSCLGLKHLSVGGEKLAPISKLPSDYRFYNGYGPTECTIFSTIQPYDKPYDRIPIGKALDNYRLYVVDMNQKQVPLGSLGELYIAGYGVGKGYLNQEEKTKATFIENPFSKEEGFAIAYRTGDIVRRLPNGAIDFIGRNDGQVKVRGFRIELSEVEAVIREYKGIKDVTVQAFRDEKVGDLYLAAYITSNKKIDVDDLKEFIRRQKPPYMVPPYIMQLDAIPLNQNQKVNKRALPKPSYEASKVEVIAPETPLEKEIYEIFKGVLGAEEFSVTDSFFNIGGTSLSAAKVVMQVQAMGHEIAYKDVFDYPSPRDLAFLIESRSEKKEEAPVATSEAKAEITQYESLKYNDVKYVDEVVSDRELGTVLLTGATGFLGIHILKELLQSKTKTIVLIRGRDIDPLLRLKGLAMYYFDYPLEDEIDELVTVIDGDITDASLEERLKDLSFDTIVNAAACVKHFASDDSIERI